MKKLILYMGLCLLSYQGYTQDFRMMAETMKRKQGQYDTGYKSITDSYTYLMNLQLINKQNISRLNIYRESVKKNFQDVSKVDFSIPANVQEALRVINQYNEEKPIKDEISLLNKISSEVENMRLKNPEGYSKSDRFKELLAILKEVEICNPKDIRDIGWKNGFL